ncbi:putative quinol monooxygenase [Niallia sp. 03133]|uniref:putative quinol monooxygenase n=1 Tax=Niallia sp. 03133 TaxID=3458060 RepID=UPI0040450AF9
MEITLTAIIRAQPGKEKKLQKLLKNLVEPSRNEKGCISYELNESLEENGLFVFYEKWKSNEAIQYHNKTAHFIHVQKEMEQLVESTEVLKLKIV